MKKRGGRVLAGLVVASLAVAVVLAMCALGTGGDMTDAHVTHLAQATKNSAESFDADVAQGGGTSDVLAVGSGIGPSVDDVFVMPVDAEYEPNVVLVEVRDGATAPDVIAALSGVDGLNVGSLTNDDIVGGYACLELDEGVSVEEAVNRLSAAGDAIVAAQPNYVYRVMDDDGASTLRRRLDATLVGGDATGVAGNGGANIDSLTAPPGAASADDGVVGRGVRTSSVAAAESDSTTSNVEPGPSAFLEALAAEVSVNDPDVGKQWALASMRVYAAWAMAKAGSPSRGAAVGVAVLDTGFDVSHVDLKGNIVAPYNSDTKSSAINGLAGPNTRHGTHVSGILSAVANNGIGVAGVSFNARLMPVRVADDDGRAETDDLIRAYDYVMAQAKTYNIRVINLSMGVAMKVSDDAFIRKVDEAYAAGIVTVAAAGNSNQGTVPYDCYPSDHETIVSVINLQKWGSTVKLSDTSNYNKPGEANKDISAPGTVIWSTLPGNTYDNMSGTSMAAPAVAGVLALEFAADPSLTAEQAKQFLYVTAQDLGRAGFDEQYGYGEVDAARAVQLADAYGKVDALPTAVAIALSDKDAVISARSAYDTLDTAQRTYVDASRIVAAENRISELEVARVRSLVAVLPTSASLTLANRDAVVTARSAYDALTSAQKAQLVGTQATLIRAEERIVQLENAVADANAKIAALPVAARITLADKASVASARAAYDALDATQRAAVDASSLLAAEQRIAELEQIERQRSQGLSVAYQAHVQDLGWQSDLDAHDGVLAGTTGHGQRVEALCIELRNKVVAGSVEYRAYVENEGWQPWKKDGAVAGTTGAARRVEALQVRLTGSLANYYDVWYCVHAQNFGWMGWTRNGESSGTAEYAYRVEAVKILLSTKGAVAPGPTAYAFRSPLRYQTHVATIGWQGAVIDGAMAGTSGRSLGLESIKIDMPGTPYSGTVQYHTHIQGIGWETTWAENGFASGTTGISRNLEAIQIRLTGELSNHYDIWYRVHAQDFGWLGWAKNGTAAGSSGYGRRLEAIQILVIEKGDVAPTGVGGAFYAI